MSIRVKQADIQRALRGTRAAGFDPKEIRIGSDGEIRVILTDGASMSDTEVVDEIATWAGRNGAQA